MSKKAIFWCCAIGLLWWGYVYYHDPERQFEAERAARQQRIEQTRLQSHDDYDPEEAKEEWLCKRHLLTECMTRDEVEDPPLSW